MNKKTIFWDVDTQFDFIMPEGKLYIPSAEQIIDNISSVRKFALENGFSIIASVDWHSLTDLEISQKPDFKKTFPPHCLAGQPGGKRVGFLGNLPIDFVPVEALEGQELESLLDKPQFHIVLKTNSTDVFKNPNTRNLIKLLNPQRVVVFGVALDVCVYNTVIGLAEYPEIEILLLTDAVKGLGIIPDNTVFRQFMDWKVELVTLESIKELLCGTATQVRHY